MPMSGGKRNHEDYTRMYQTRWHWSKRLACRELGCWLAITHRPPARPFSHTSDSVGSRCGQSAIGAVAKPRANGAGRHVNRDFASACEGWP